MSLARVQKQLMKDLKRSPLKAGVLGLLCVAALWCWAPLVAGWFGGSKGKAAKPQAAVAVPTTAPTPVAAGGAAAPAAASPSVPWRQLMAWMEKDPRKQSGDLGV